MLKRDEDYFKDTTMTFGEHLEELRSCLVKALLGLVIGVSIGLWFGDRVVDLIKRPLEKALGEYYITEAEKAYVAWSEARQAKELPVPYTRDQIKDLVNEQRMLYEIRYLDRVQIFGALAAEDKRLEPFAPPPHGDKAGAVQADAFVPAFFWHRVDNDARITTSVFNVQEGFMIWFKASLVVGIVLSSPWIFWQIWSFVAAGLYPHERKYIHIFLPFSLALFFAGVAMAYLLVFQPVLGFLFSFSGTLGFRIEPRISEWLSFVIFLPLGFGVSFQLPLVMLFLERIGIFTVRTYLEKWRIAILVIVILSAVLTPAEIYSMLLMACPLVVLYFGGILLCHWMPRGQFAVEPVA
ncbi:MAG TPA: twin-arginine translocase subunit TatC [Pirellulales bacterium]|nr:twin-arginine translocase subunit TatC [Pirellulales bacterium]